MFLATIPIKLTGRGYIMIQCTETSLQSTKTNLFLNLARGFARSACLVGCALAWMPLPATAQTVVDVVEYYVASLNKYFITSRANEKALLDANSSFTRTGMSFRAFAADASAPAATVPICRFYLPAPGPNTHTYLAPADCAQIIAAHLAGFNDEGRDFAVYLPDTTGTCPAVAPNPVYRSYNRRDNVNDAGHRFTADDATYVAMAARGFDSEGAVFCSVMVAAPTLALAAVVADAQITASPSGFATPAGSNPLTMRYRTLSLVIKIADTDLVSSSATGFVVRGTRALRAGDRVSAGGRFYKVVSAAVSGGNTVVTTTNPALNEIFAEFDLTGGIDLGNSAAQSAVSGDGAKLQLKDLTLSKTIKITEGVNFDGKISIPKMEILPNSRYSALAFDKPGVTNGVVLTVRGSAEIEGTLAISAEKSATYPPDAGSESAYGWKSRTGCFDLWSASTLLMGVELPICFEAELKAELKTTLHSVKKVINFELIATRNANGVITWTQTFAPEDTATLAAPVGLAASETFVTTTLGLYVAPRVVLNSFLGSVNLLSFKLRAGAEGEMNARLLPTPCTNYTINGVLKGYYSAPLFALLDVKKADDFREIITLSKLIGEQKGCAATPDGNFAGFTTGTTTFKNIGKCPGDYRASYTGIFSLDVKAGLPTALLSAFTLDEVALAAVPPDCPPAYSEAVIDQCTAFRVAAGTFEGVTDDLFCAPQSNYKFTFDSTGTKASLTWILNTRDSSWTGALQGVTELKKK